MKTRKHYTALNWNEVNDRLAIGYLYDGYTAEGAAAKFDISVPTFNNRLRILGVTRVEIQKARRTGASFAQVWDAIPYYQKAGHTLLLSVNSDVASMLKAIIWNAQQAIDHLEGKGIKQ